MSLLGYIIVFSLIGGIFSLTLAVALLANKRVARTFATYAMPFSAGALLAAVFLDLLPEGIETGNVDIILISALIGILLFFMAERFVRWFHHHHQHGETSPTVPLLIIGDTVHNVLDGIAIAAAFMISIPTGIVTALAVAAHEIPQEIAESGALLAQGMSRKRILIVNLLSALVATLAAVVTYFIGQASALPMSVIFGLSAGFLLYVALSDIIPALHENHDKKKLFDWQPVLLVVGVLTVVVAMAIVHSFVEV